MSLEEARLEANLNHRATHLFVSGYRAKWRGNRLLEMNSPQGETYEIDTVEESCTCPFFTNHDGKHGCKHVMGYPKLLRDQEAMQAQQVQRARREEMQA